MALAIDQFNTYFMNCLFYFKISYVAPLEIVFRNCGSELLQSLDFIQDGA